MEELKDDGQEARQQNAQHHLRVVEEHEQCDRNADEVEHPELPHQVTFLLHAFFDDADTGELSSSQRRLLDIAAVRSYIVSHNN